jgi:hypothetical protein
METAAVIAAVNAAVDLIQALAPSVQAAIAKGEISPEVQAALKTKLDSLRTDAAFTGPEWET